MDECMYHENFAGICKLCKTNSIIHSYHISEIPVQPLKIIGTCWK